jgi:transketolase
VVQDLEPLTEKWQSFGFAVRNVDGHNVDVMRDTLLGLPFELDRPNCIIAHTVKGRGLPEAENNPAWHHKSKISDDEVAAMLAAIGE